MNSILSDHSLLESARDALFTWAKNNSIQHEDKSDQSPSDIKETLRESIHKKIDQETQTANWFVESAVRFIRWLGILDHYYINPTIQLVFEAHKSAILLDQNKKPGQKYTFFFSKYEIQILNKYGYDFASENLGSLRVETQNIENLAQSWRRDLSPFLQNELILMGEYENNMDAYATSIDTRLEHNLELLKHSLRSGLSKQRILELASLKTDPSHEIRRNWLNKKVSSFVKMNSPGLTSSEINLKKEILWNLLKIDPDLEGTLLLKYQIRNLTPAQLPPHLKDKLNDFFSSESKNKLDQVETELNKLIPYIGTILNNNKNDKELIKTRLLSNVKNPTTNDYAEALLFQIAEDLAHEETQLDQVKAGLITELKNVQIISQLWPKYSNNPNADFIFAAACKLLFPNNPCNGALEGWITFVKNSIEADNAFFLAEYGQWETNDNLEPLPNPQAIAPKEPFESSDNFSKRIQSFLETPPHQRDFYNEIWHKFQIDEDNYESLKKAAEWLLQTLNDKKKDLSNLINKELAEFLPITPRFFLTCYLYTSSLQPFPPHEIKKLIDSSQTTSPSNKLLCHQLSTEITRFTTTTLSTQGASSVVFDVDKYSRTTLFPILFDSLRQFALNNSGILDTNLFLLLQELVTQSVPNIFSLELMNQCPNSFEQPFMLFPTTPATSQRVYKTSPDRFDIIYDLKVLLKIPNTHESPVKLPVIPFQVQIALTRTESSWTFERVPLDPALINQDTPIDPMKTLSSSLKSIFCFFANRIRLLCPRH